MATFQLFFNPREQVVVRWGQIWRIGWVIKTLEAQVGQFLLGCKNPFGDFSAAFFLQNALQLHQPRLVVLRVDSLALWKIISEEDAVMIPKYRGENFSNGFFPSEFFGACGVSRYAATPFIVALPPGHCNMTRFRPWSPIAKGIIWIALKKKSKSCLDVWQRWRFWSAFRHIGTHFAENFRMSESSWMVDPTRSREMSSCWAIDLTENRRSSKISSWIWSIISEVVTVLGRPGRGASQVEKSPSLNWATQFLTVAYDSACSSNVSVRMAWISFGTLPCRKKENLMTACVSMLLKSRALPDTLPFSLCNKKRLAIRHMNRPLFPTTLSIPS